MLHAIRLFCCGWSVLLLAMTSGLSAQESATESGSPFVRERLVAWCIVPFDSQKRTPEQRAEMLRELGLRRLAYDYRAEHVATFEGEILALQAAGIELTAWWFPTELNDEARLI
ncbi:MAG: hypothetical protein ACKO81_18065, partial [Planctomycetota bacterium]